MSSLTFLHSKKDPQHTLTVLDFNDEHQFRGIIVCCRAAKAHIITSKRCHKMCCIEF